MKILLVMFTLASTGWATSDIKTDSITIHPGEVRLVTFPVPDKGAIFSCRGEVLKWSHKNGHGRAVVIESYFSELHPYACKVELNGKIAHQIEFRVVGKEYKAEVLKVNSKTIKLAAKDEERVWKEQKVLDRIYASSQNELLFEAPFVQPMNSAITSMYGTKRVYNQQKKSQHLGIDYRAPIGQKVPATNAGVVMFAGDLFYTGWTVILDHGLDIFTVYGHLDKTLVKAGSKVKQGEVIGLSGNTGRTSGPHLHWGVKVHGQYIDGMSLIDETQKYFQK
jgi:murein DD-endopeptidase MepM/ murein hydrolase activator NlpD